MGRERRCKTKDGLYRGLMRRGAGDELAAGCAKSEMFHAAEQATMHNSLF